MKNQRLALINRARMSVLNAIRRFADTEVEENFQNALRWLNAATRRVQNGGSGEDALLEAAVHLQTASITLGFAPAAIHS